MRLTLKDCYDRLNPVCCELLPIYLLRSPQPASQSLATWKMKSRVAMARWLWVNHVGWERWGKCSTKLEVHVNREKSIYMNRGNREHIRCFCLLVTLPSLSIVWCFPASCQLKAKLHISLIQSGWVPARTGSTTKQSCLTGRQGTDAASDRFAFSMSNFALRFNATINQRIPTINTHHPCCLSSIDPCVSFNDDITPRRKDSPKACLSTAQHRNPCLCVGRTVAVVHHNELLSEIEDCLQK